MKTMRMYVAFATILALFASQIVSPENPTTHQRSTGNGRNLKKSKKTKAPKAIKSTKAVKSKNNKAPKSIKSTKAVNAKKTKAPNAIKQTKAPTVKNKNKKHSSPSYQDNEAINLRVSVIYPEMII